MTLSHHAVVSHWKNFFIRVPLMLYTLFSIVVLGGAVCLNR